MLMKSNRVDQKGKVSFRHMFHKIFKSVLPFVLLITFNFCAAGIFYAVEKNYCSSSGRIKYLYSILEPKELTYWQAVHFIFIIETTIGYGDVVPCTIWGQILTIVFALIGLPLSLMCLTHLGHALQLLLCKLHRNALKLCCHCRLNSAPHLRKDADTVTHEDEDDKETVPLSIGLIVTVLWILFCSVYFYVTLRPYYSINASGDFTYFSAIYFTVITFLTIGLGDISPINYEWIALTSVLILIGLALFTMCIDLMHIKLHTIFAKAERLIQTEYQQNLLDDKETGIDSLRSAKREVKRLMRGDHATLWYTKFMSKKDKRQLAEYYFQKANQRSKIVQTERNNTLDNFTDMQIAWRSSGVQTVKTRMVNKSTDVEGIPKCACGYVHSPRKTGSLHPGTPVSLKFKVKPRKYVQRENEDNQSWTSSSHTGLATTKTRSRLSSYDITAERSSVSLPIEYDRGTVFSREYPASVDGFMKPMSKAPTRKRRRVSSPKFGY